MDKTKIRFFLAGLSPWILLGAVLILIAIVVSMTVANLNRQKEQGVRLMTEKGAALIRSFEAGTRMGMRGGHGRGFQLQRLLVETASQSDIAHLLVARLDGTVIAHSRVDLVGSRYESDLDLEAVFRSGTLAWRRSPSIDDTAVFEVYGKFAPLSAPMHGPMYRHKKESLPMMMAGPEAPPMVIFVGLRTDAVDMARAANARHTIIMSLVLLLVGCTGVLLLFLVQNYRSAEIQALRRELEENQRLATVGRLAAGVAHEIRNPLSSIKGFATYFMEKYRESEKDREIAEIMVQEVDRLNRVVGQLLEFSKPLRLHCQPVAVKSLLEDAMRLVARQSEEAHVAMRMDLADEALWVNMDADKMSQVVLNLLLNAFEAMPEGGKLQISARGDLKTGLQLTIADTGRGIDPEDRPHIFEPYFSTKKTGTGLGLAIVHNIVKAHRGAIRVESPSEGGTRVTISLPTEQEA